MLTRPDIAVYAPDDGLQLVVEVKNKRDASPEWAMQMRRNLLVHGVIPPAPFFLLVLPDTLYLWAHGADQREEASPDYRAATADVLTPYFGQLTLPLHELGEYGLELLVRSWLNVLVRSDLSGEPDNPAFQWLFDSGLYDAIKDGAVTAQAAA